MAKITLRLYDRSGPVPHDDSRSLPTFYMNDWSELALVVSDRLPALGLLRDQGVGISTTPSGTRLRFETLDQIPAAIQLLQARGLAADVSDSVVQVYQG